MKPLISIILPIYNAETTIEETLSSIINQGLTDWELIVINDGSTDNSLQIIKSFNDKRIKIINNPTNKGLIYSLNKGFDLATGEYIARMDADDIMHRDRLYKQYNFLDGNKDIDICGGFIELFNDSRKIGRQIYGISNDEIRAELIFNSPIAHPTYLIRRAAIKGYQYNSKYKYCEDYELLSRFLLDNHRAANLPKVLLEYRISPNSQTKQGESNSLERYKSISATQSYILEKGLGLRNDDYYRKLHYSLSLNDRIMGIDVQEFPIKIIKKYLDRIRFNNRIYDYCSKDALALSLGKIWLKLIRYKGRENLDSLIKLVVSKYTSFGVRYFTYRIKWIIKK